jgi:hypothetical protein
MLKWIAGISSTVAAAVFIFWATEPFKLFFRRSLRRHIQSLALGHSRRQVIWTTKHIQAP